MVWFIGTGRYRLEMISARAGGLPRGHLSVIDNGPLGQETKVEVKGQEQKSPLVKT